MPNSVDFSQGNKTKHKTANRNNVCEHNTTIAVKTIVSLLFSEILLLDTSS